MNIAIVASANGNQRHRILSVARELGREHHVTIYSRRDNSDGKPKTRVAPGVTLEHIDVGPAKELVGDDVVPYLNEVGNQLMKRWSQERPDVIHAHSWTGGLVAVAGAKGLGVPVTQTFYTVDTTHMELERALGRRADAVIAGSGDEESALIRLGVPRNNIAVVPYGVDTERFQRRGAIATRGSRKRLLHVGPLSIDRGAHTIVRALQGLGDVELVIAGGPEPEDLDQDRDARRLRALAEQLGVADRVTLLGQVKRAAVPKLMRSADAVVSVPREAVTGIVALEAMACGVPVIASAVGAHLDSIIDGVTGLLVPPDRPARTARLARELLYDPTLRTALGYAGADRARSRYSWERVSQELVRVYEAACA
ncbi:glycosyltransferase [Nonomuraea gerenzanensis]|uniref:Glycosyl transferase, group 1 n=1 Tax=Nonomuraea gerenzanensis TaxID=93944 RepID=A0A1M4E7I9_9ACTN|nr:glycosyltransferase [Nonomuraea gerenzanensis]UBU17086.1 glycosyltransferase [Nonomuraea gerenzanensis]SBO94820.1 Glycosyl transferase, group 1 [Nonomuraea gerenzanensis]